MPGPEWTRPSCPKLTNADLNVQKSFHYSLFLMHSCWWMMRKTPCVFLLCRNNICHLSNINTDKQAVDVLWFCLSEGKLYSATVADFMARDSLIYRSMGDGLSLRTMQYDSKWLKGLWQPLVIYIFNLFTCVFMCVCVVILNTNTYNIGRVNETFI